MKKMFIPGPVEVSKNTLIEMARPMMYHRSREFKDILKEVKKLISELLETKNEVFLLTSSATGAMESVIRSCVEKKVLCIANGEFGRRFYEIAISNGKEAELLDFGDGNNISYEKIVHKLVEKKFDAVTFVANETSTGIENNLEAIREIIDSVSPNTLLLADAVTAAFGTKIDVNKADALLFGTQKALALPPGLAILIANKKALTKSEHNKNKGYYFDLTRIKKCNDDDLTLTTPNIPLLYALRKKLFEIKAKGLNRFINEHKEKAELVRKWAEENGFELLVKEKYSKTVTVIENTRDIDMEKTIRMLEKSGYCIANGYGPLKDKTFRIGHMGDITIEDTRNMLYQLERLLIINEELKVFASKTI